MNRLSNQNLSHAIIPQMLSAKVRLCSRALVAGLLCAVIALSAYAADWDRGVALYNKGDYAAALAEFQDVIQLRPDAAGAWYYVGLCEFKLKRYKEVREPLSRAIALLEIQDPASKDLEGAWYTIGFSHYLQGEYEKAIEPLKRYIERAGTGNREVDSSARSALGRAYFFLEKYDEAQSYLGGNAPQKERTRETAADLYYAGVIYFKRENDDRAIAALRESIKANGEDPAALDLLAESLMRKARKGNSNPEWLEAAEVGEKLRAVRDDMRTANLLGRAYLGAKQFEKAADPLGKLAKANPDDAQAWLYYGIALSRSGQTRKAMEALEITIRIAPDSGPALAELGYVYESDKQYQQAMRIYEMAYKASGSSDPSIKQSIDRVKALAQQP
ncbi:MAG TPA: tetratricopeptide repeat protein [Blastocatellia bacterium]|nr:tetratricopeptide repeat protein [Blastocatellia bacterium]